MVPQREKDMREGSEGDRTPQQARLRSETKHGIAVVLLFAATLILVLSYVNVAGGVGKVLKESMEAGFGIPMVFIPLGIGFIAYALMRPADYMFRWTNILGLVLSLLAITGFFHLFIPLDQAVDAVGEFHGGGYAGLILSYPLQRLMGPWASGVVLLAAFIISLLLVFDTSLKHLAERASFLERISARFGRFRDRMNAHLDSTGDEDEGTQTEETDFERREVTGSNQVSTASPEESATEPSKTPQHIAETVQGTLFPGLRKQKRTIVVPLDLLEANGQKPASGDVGAIKELIRKTLETFGIPVEMDEVHVGPTVTQYTLKPAEGVKLSQLTTLSNDLALALAAHPIRIEAPIPGKALVGIEVPNKSVAIVRLRQVLASEEFKKRKSNLTLALGMDVAGHPWVADLDAMPHLLLAGATGSGKSVMINSIVLSLVFQNSPDELKLILVDPKRVELPVYNDIPYLLTPVVTQVDKTINALRWVVGEMDRRFDVLSQHGKKDIREFNASMKDSSMPYIVVIVDELADLMAVAMREVEGAIIRLAQMARAVGIHLIVATQRPSVDVITGLIKANITSRIAFSVASVVDSRTILDVSGAEKLLGKGDLLFMSAQLSKPRRLQGAFIGTQEIERVANFLRQKGKPDYLTDIVQKTMIDESIGGNFEDLGDDELLSQAKELVIKAGKASASLLQRRLRVGYARAARLLDLLEEQGIIGPGEGAKPRDILVSRPAGTNTGGETVDSNDGENEEYS
ncbi:MAG: hypothetical protein A2898_01530 [Candidatus Kerfeldbacteria bacterium RIFCSPLOWO2_01_FULL_48_11]|uniref:FtsK domain-containing protein n=1 Tax=Candidatus Kerfeldbacteria bacterium RIFCSPLOWO2_01_FULL_48_11 TaxID=1798543 RepID=A0A1G2B453_9BACT|nr:MAG: hypothetical protein A2898_01530 [Candidatus Kerfeldbacteria bacterium RIFCSPLOWO2_01_FULL_48_11]